MTHKMTLIPDVRMWTLISIYTMSFQKKQDPDTEHFPLDEDLHLILTLNKHADDQLGLWLSGGAGPYTD